MQRLGTFAGFVMCLWCSGCSFMFVEGPPPKSAGAADAAPVTCTTSRAAPVIDTVVTALQVVRVGYAVGASDSAYDGFPISRGADMGIGVILAGAFAVSAIHGFSSTSACEEATAEAAAAADDAEWQAPPPRRATPPPARGAAPAPAPPPPARPLPRLDAMCRADGDCGGLATCEQGACRPARIRLPARAPRTEAAP